MPVPDASEDLRRRLDAAPMSAAQVAAVAITVALSALDGFDVLSVTFAAPAIVREWGIGKAALGTLLASGLAGMAIGSIALAPLADRIGRRRMVIANLVLMAVGMGASALAGSLALLELCRFATGLGIGAMVAVINPLAAEFSNARRRSLAVAAMTVGYPLGGLVGGLLAASLLAARGWHAVFVAGGAAALVMLPVVILFLPESPAFLLLKGKGGQLDALLRRFGRGPVTLSYAPAADRRGGYSAVFAGDQRGRTMRMVAINLLFVLAVYYALSWLPQLVVDAGFSPAQASLVGAVANLAGIAGGLTLGQLAKGSRLRRLTVFAMAATGLLLALIEVAPDSLALFLLGAGACGFFLFAGMAGLYNVLAASFPVAARASGVGFVIGIGRVGSAVAPALAGWLFAAGLGRGAVSAVFGVCALAAAAVLASVPARTGGARAA